MRASGCRGAGPVRHRQPGVSELPRHLRGAADQARAGVQPERGTPRGLRRPHGEREGRGGGGRRSARGGARRRHRVLRHQRQAAGAQGRMARTGPDGGDHLQLGRARYPQRGRRGDVRPRHRDHRQRLGERDRQPSGRAAPTRSSEASFKREQGASSCATSSPARSRSASGRTESSITRTTPGWRSSSRPAAPSSTKLIAEGTNRTIPREWFASQKYSIPPAS